MLHHAPKMWGIQVNSWTPYKRPVMAAVWYRSHPEDKAIYDAEFEEDNDESEDDDMDEDMDENEYEDGRRIIEL
jgi:hypothetical protein